VSKTLETKKRILNLLKKKEMTISGLSEELNLSTATISQHIDELQRAGAIEKIDNEHFKKLKYYRTVETTTPMVSKYVKYVVGALVVLAVIAGAFFVYRGSPTTSPHVALNDNVSNNNSQNVTPVIGGGAGAFACPMEFYQLNGSITNYSGFSVYNLNYNNGTVADYVISPGSAGKLYATEHVSNVLQEPSGFNYTRQHYVALEAMNRSSNTTFEGINTSISPQNYTIQSGSSMNLTVSVATLANATGTYWVRIDGPCDGGVTEVLLTVGNKPYNGTITQGLNRFA
jgi:DNA-binding transcriptional ArsR family regulator